MNSPKIPQPVQKNIDCRPATPPTFFVGIALTPFAVIVQSQPIMMTILRAYDV